MSTRTDELSQLPPDTLADPPLSPQFDMAAQSPETLPPTPPPTPTTPPPEPVD